MSKVYTDAYSQVSTAQGILTSIVAACLVIADACWPCGTLWPNCILTYSEGALLAGPEASFDRELERILATVKPDVNLPQGSSRSTDFCLGGESTVRQDLQDLDSALYSLDLTKDGKQRLLRQYKEIRRKVSQIPLTDVIERSPGQAAISEASRTEAANLVIPATIPKEFSEYLYGATQYHLGNIEEARKHWLAVIDLPEKERKYRTIWAAYMLGRSWEKEDPSQAVEWFEKVRTWSKDFYDTLDLDIESVGWQARAEYQRKNFCRALDLYMAQYQTGVNASLSIKIVARALVNTTSSEVITKAAMDPLAQRVVTAYLISVPNNYYSEDGAVFGGREDIDDDLYENGKYSSFEDAWLDALDKVSLDRIHGAERLAWVAYNNGAVKQCGRWLELADPDLNLTQWIRAKMLLRNGDVEQARKILAKLAPQPRPEEYWQDWNSSGNPEIFKIPPQTRCWASWASSI